MKHKRPLKILLILLPVFAAIFAGLAMLVYYLTPARPDGEPVLFESVSTFAGPAGDLVEPFGITTGNGLVFFSDGATGRIYRAAAPGTFTVIAEGLNTPSGIAMLSNGDLVAADTGSHTIRQIGMDGSVRIIAGIENTPGFADGPAASALFSGPIGIAVGPEDKIFVSDTYNDRIRVIANGQVTTLAGGERGFADGPGSAAKFDLPLGIAAWNTDKLLVADSKNARLRVVEPDGTTWTLAGTGAEERMDGPLAIAAFVLPTAVTADQFGRVFVADGNSLRVIGGRAFPFVETITDARRGFANGRLRDSRFNRPSGLVYDDVRGLLIADSDNRSIRVIGQGDPSQGGNDAVPRDSAAEFRSRQPGRWPYDPPQRTREIAGTLGEIRGRITEENLPAWFHNGLDIAGGYGETAVFVRSEIVLEPDAAAHFNTSRELLRMPTMGYIHIRIGRSQNDVPFDDPRFRFSSDESGKLSGVRIMRGTRFNAGDRIGTLNSQNHVHLIAGRPGDEINALAALELPGVSDSIMPTIEDVSLADENWQEIETPRPGSRINLQSRTRVIVRAYDRVDGNAERRRLGLYRLGYQIIRSGGAELSPPNWTIVFDRMPPNEGVRYVYAPGSRSGATGGTIFNYIVTNRISGEDFGEGFIDPAALENGSYTLRVFAADYFGNTTTKEISFEVSR